VLLLLCCNENYQENNEVINYCLIGLNISFKDVTAFTQNIWDADYIPSHQEIENLISLFIFIKVLNWLTCWVCKYVYWLTIAMLIWLVYLDNEVDHD
jgi:hypothetical protein